MVWPHESSTNIHDAIAAADLRSSTPKNWSLASGQPETDKIALLALLVLPA